MYFCFYAWLKYQPIMQLLTFPSLGDAAGRIRKKTNKQISLQHLASSYDQTIYGHNQTSQCQVAPVLMMSDRTHLISKAVFFFSHSLSWTLDIFGQYSCFVQINYAVRGWGLIRPISICYSLMLYLFKLFLCFWHLADLKFRFRPTFRTSETITIIAVTVSIVITLFNFGK